FFSIEKNKVSEDTLMDIALEAGAEDIISDKQYHEITCSIASFEAVKGALAKNNISTVVAEITMIPTTTVAVTGADAKAILSLIEALEDHDDVQNVYANFDISDEEMEKLSAEDA
ncbi:MAG: YebC/PmpR family DNA-binding transcriptional regulator, partial [Candidatus Omnitrophica bacterium CG12_big_fil_rev_8_21_14_0_65_50_5]